MRRIVFVDDAGEVLQHLQRTLAPMKSEWDMQFFASGAEALELIASSGCDVVVSDMVMPKMDGAELLAEVQNICPHAVRIMLSGDQTPFNHVRSSIVAHRFLNKPLDMAMLKATIRQADQLRTLLGNPALRALVKEITTLPSLPSIYQELMQEIRSPQSSLKKVARIIGKDLAMMAKILQLVNSAFFGLRTHVSSPEQAVALLGFDAIKSLVLSTQVFRQFDRAQLPSFSLEALWQHVVLAGGYARTIAKEEGVDQRVVESAYTAALLHDLGALVLAANRPEDYAQVMDLVKTRPLADWQAEREIFGADHAHVGAYLLGLWGLSEPIVEAVAYHHHPLEYVASGFTAVTAVHVGNQLAEAQLQGRPVEEAFLGSDLAYLSREQFEGRMDRWRAICLAA